MLRLVCGASTLVLATAVFAAPDSFKDPLDIPALMLKRQLVSTQMSAVTHAGNRLVAVGIRGLVLVSNDGGKQWVQASVPVASDLLDVNFPTAKDGWVVGHDGIILHTKDGGTTWEKQLDGRMAKKLLTEHFQSLVANGNAQAQRYLQDTQLNYQTGPEQSLLSVWFKDSLNGFVCGSFGILLATHDGGVTWESWVENVDSDMPLHYYAIRGTKQGVLIGSEKGLVFRLDPEKNRFVPIPTGYTGTFFSLLETGDTVFALGLRGTAYRMKDGGVGGVPGKWEKVETGVASAISGSTVLPDGAGVLVSLSGQLVITRDGGEHFQQIPVVRPMSFSGVSPGAAGSVVVVGSEGVRAIPFQ